MVHGPRVYDVFFVLSGPPKKLSYPPGTSHFNFSENQLKAYADVLYRAAEVGELDDGDDGSSAYELMNNVRFNNNRDIVEKGGENSVIIPLVPLLAIPPPAVYP